MQTLIYCCRLPFERLLLPTLLAVFVGILGSWQASSAGESAAYVTAPVYQPQVPLIIPTHTNGGTWTSGSLNHEPVFVAAEAALPTVETESTPTLSTTFSTKVYPKTKEQRQRSKARKQVRAVANPDIVTTQDSTCTAAPVTLLAWNLPCEAGIVSHKITSEQQISLETNGSLDLTQGWVRFPDSSARIVRGIQAFENFSLFVDVTCDNAQQAGPARILSCSKDCNERNFTLGQQADAFTFRVRTSQHDSNGTHREVTFGKVVAGQRQQVYVQYNGCTLTCFVDGTMVAEHKLEIDFSSWQQFAVQAGNEATGDRPWAGHLHGVLMLPEVDQRHGKRNCSCKDTQS